MPYASAAQRGYFHTPEGMAKVGPEVVAEFDKASKGQTNLPERAPKKKKNSLDYGQLVKRAQQFS